MEKPFAIGAVLAGGLPPPEAVKRAQECVTEAIRTGLPMGSGRCPTNHLSGVRMVKASTGTREGRAWPRRTKSP